MRKALKRSLSLLLAITIIFGSMYVGLGEIDWGSVFAVAAETTYAVGDIVEFGNYKQNGIKNANGEIIGFDLAPIKWRIIKIENGKALLLSEEIIDSKPYNSTSATVDGYYANNYAHSDIREWLINDFYNTAFSTIEKNMILSTTLDNSACATDVNASGSYTKYSSESTTDKVFLLSKSEADSYAVNYFKTTVTDYAYANGFVPGSGTEPSNHWLLRTAGNNTYQIYTVHIRWGKYKTYFNWYDDTISILHGVRPAICVDLDYFQETGNTLFNVPEVVDSDSYTINVKALSNEENEDGTKKEKPVDGAKVTVYLGTDAVITKKIVDSGKVTFTKNELIEKGVSAENISNCTVSAHLQLEDGFELCSEKVSPNGVWEGEPITNFINNSGSYLLVDKPRKYFSVNFGYTASTKNQETREEIVKEVLGEFSERFAEMTNGYALISDIQITSYNSDIDLMSADHNFYLFDDAENALGIEMKSASTFIEKGFIIFSCKNGTTYFNAETLCHEAGHLFFKFYDEYCYGLGYYTDTNNDGKVCNSTNEANRCSCNEKHVDKKNTGNWKKYLIASELIPINDGVYDRPDGSPSNFGLMENQKNSIELSNKDSYSYLRDSLFNADTPELYTKHYYVYKQSTEETLCDYLNSIAVSKGYSTNFYSSAGNNFNSTYWYASINNFDVVEAAENQVFIGDNIEMFTSSAVTDIETFVDFAVYENSISFSFENSYQCCVFLKNQNTVKEIDVLQSDNLYSGEISITEDSINEFYIVKNIDGNYLREKIYLFYDVDGTLKVEYDKFIENENFYSISNIINVLCVPTNMCTLERTLTFGDNIDFENTSWYMLENDVFTKVDTIKTYGEDNRITFSCDSQVGCNYVLMTKTAGECASSLTNISIVNNQNCDGSVSINLDDSSEDNVYYVVYYSSSPINDITDEGLKTKVFSRNDGDLTIFLDNEGKYYFAIEEKKSDGSNCITLNACSYEYKCNDSDNDGIPDYWLDIYYQLKDLDDIAGTDSDGDSLTNIKEYENGTNPLNPDTDGDNVYDVIEIVNNLNPLEPMTDGVTDDYTIVYGAPDLKVTGLSFDDDYVYFNVCNETDGKAMRTIVDVTNDGASVASWTVNIDSQSTIEFSVDRTLINSISNFKIEVDSAQITNDTDYSNNSFKYIPATSIVLEDITLVKGTSHTAQIICEPTTADELCKWSFVSGSNNISVVSETGVVSSIGIGQALIQVETLGGLTADCTVTAVPFEGSEYTGFDCEIINDGTELAIIGYIGNDTDITIPDSIGSLPVTQLNDDCIPSGVANVTVPASVSVISYNAFYGCGTLSSINVDENNSSYSSADGVLFNKDKTELILYPRNKACSEYVVPNGVIAVMNNAFENCTNLTMVTVSGSVECIGDFAFSDSTNLSSVIISDGVTSIGYAAFLNCERLTSINVDEDNAEFSSIDGVLFNKDKTTLIQYPAGKTDVRYTIPDSVTAIDDMAFMGCSKLGELVISDALESIGEEAITQCSSFKYVFYQGSESDWSNVSIGIDNGSLTTAKIHYNSTDHTYEYKVDKEATCTKDGLKHLECTVCTYCLDPEIIPSPGHDYSTEWTIDVAPTCTEKGSKSRHCTVCDDKSDVTVIEPNGHSYSDEWTIDIAPTCTTEGSKSHHCSVCDVKTDITVISILEHEMVNDICKYCGLSDVWEYEMKDGSIVITQYNGNSSEVVIPSEICGVPVIGIGDNLFYNCTSLTSITIPESVTTIGNYAFFNCSALTSVTFPEGLTTIGNYAFTSCTGLTSIEIPDSVTSVGVYAFGECGFLKSVVMSKNVTEINESTFYNCYYLASFTIPEGVTRIGNTAFYGCKRLKTVEIPDSVTSIENGAFSGCKALTSIDLNENITSLGSSVFYGCSNLTSITIPSKVTTINPHTFYNCNNISYVIISDKVTGIGKNVFYGFTGTIYCVENSVAHEYASTNGIAYVLVNNLINASDTTSTQIDYNSFVIRTSVQGCNDISEIIGKSQSAIIVATPSYEYNELKIYGTGTTVAVFDGDNFIGEFTMVVDCDLNGDSVVDVLDSSQMALASSGKKTLDGAYALAGDSNSDDIIDISDYQDVVNKAVS